MLDVSFYPTCMVINEFPFTL